MGNHPLNHCMYHPNDSDEETNNDTSFVMNERTTIDTATNIGAMTSTTAAAATVTSPPVTSRLMPVPTLSSSISEWPTDEKQENKRSCPTTRINPTRIITSSFVTTPARNTPTNTDNHIDSSATIESEKNNISTDSIGILLAELNINFEDAIGEDTNHTHTNDDDDSLLSSSGNYNSGSSSSIASSGSNSSTTKESSCTAVPTSFSSMSMNEDDTTREATKTIPNDADDDDNKDQDVIQKEKEEKEDDESHKNKNGDDTCFSFLCSSSSSSNKNATPTSCRSKASANAIPTNNDNGNEIISSIGKEKRNDDGPNNDIQIIKIAPYPPDMR